MLMREAQGAGSREETPDRELRVGFVGCGAHATMNLYPSLAFSPVQLVAVCDMDEERMDKVRRTYGADEGFTAVADMLDGPELDAVLVCGPPELHVEAAIQALNRGLHVFIEKPPAPDLKGALAIQEAANHNDRYCTVGFMKRFALRYLQAKDIMATSAFGETTQLSIKYSHWHAPNLEWMLTFMTVHLFDLMRFFVGDIERISFERNDTGGQHSFSIAGRATSGALLTLTTSGQEPRIKEHVEIVGEGELIVVDNVIELEYHRRVAPHRNFTSSIHDIQLVRPDFAIPNAHQNTLFLQGYAGIMVDFATSLARGLKPAVTIEDGVAAMRLVDLFLNNPPGAYTQEDWA